jgi:DNA-binding winged helix-turn-helix (wHTH) protein/pimeloyl-ACP methyl ester carboxylesterase
LIYTFESCSVDTERREIRRDAQVVTVEPQVFDILVHLIQNRERVVSNDELIAAIWNGRIVSESTLSSRMSAVRQAVGDSGERQNLIRTFSRKGYRFVGAVRQERTVSKNPAVDLESAPLSLVKQTVTICRTTDGINLAVASLGTGQAVVRAAHWVSSIEYDWQNPITGPLLQRLAHKFRLVRYDGRGSGLSDREVPTVSPLTMVHDLEAVVDTISLDRFVLLGMSGGAATSIAYAVRHPHRVSKLVLHGGYALGRNKRRSHQQLDEAKAFLTMVRSGWGDENSAFTRSFYSFWMPTASPEQLKSFIRYQTGSHDVKHGVKLRTAVDNIDVLDLLPKVIAPTIVFHSIRDALVPFEQGRRLAAVIPNARFVALDSDNHALLPDEPAWTKYIEEMEAFLGDSVGGRIS